MNLHIPSLIFPLFLFLFFISPPLTSATNNRPVIGILTEPVLPEFKNMGNQYLAASYVKWIESGGARVVPIHVDVFANNLTALHSLWKSLNGFLIPGGGVHLYNSNFMTVLDHVYSWSSQSNRLRLSGRSSESAYGLPNRKVDAGYTPIWGTCMGFQSVLVTASNNNFTILQDGFDSENLQLSLDFSGQAQSSRLFAQSLTNGEFPGVYSIFETQTVTMNNHQAGVTPLMFNTNPILPNSWKILSTNLDRNSREFISTAEHNDYPFYVSQWHPEKTIFEWPNPKQENVPHWNDAIRANLYTNHFFVNECRKSTHEIDPDTLNSIIIYNTSPTYTGGPEGISVSFEQCYFWK